MDLRNSFLNLTADQGRAFSQLIDHAVSATEQRVPENSSPVSALVGRPLALVRAELRLEKRGLAGARSEKQLGREDEEREKRFSAAPESSIAKKILRQN